jgi:biotin carboxylase
MSKSILVIGAGLAQVDAIEKAKELGYTVLVSDGSPHAPGLKIAHESKIIDVKDIELNLKWAKEANISGVISYASDIALHTVLAIRETLDLPGLNRKALGISLDKAQQRELFQKVGIDQPKFTIIKSREDLQYGIAQINYPCIIKPVDNSGSRGVSFICDESEIEKAYQSAISSSPTGVIILEEFMDGVELTIEGFSVNGEHHILAISDKYKPQGTFCVATQLAYPAAISKKNKEKITNQMIQAYEAAGIDDTPTHSEVILTKDGPKIVEISCRGGGFYVFSKVVQSVSGYDIVKNWTNLCVGEKVELPSVQEQGTVLRFFAAEAGKLQKVEGFRDAMSLQGVEGGLFIQPGEVIPELKTDGSRTGWMITRGRDRDSAVQLADQVSKKVVFFTEPHDDGAVT